MTSDEPCTADLSVIVPFHDVGPYAAQTLHSLTGSARPGIEFVLVDDASTDETTTILRAGADRLPGARLIRSETNLGLAGARNLGLRAASGEYLAFLDGDDFVAPGYYPELLAAARRLGCDLIRTDHVRVLGRRRWVHRINHGPRGRVCRPRQGILPVHRQTSVDAPYAWAGLAHRRLHDRGLLGFDERLATCEDRPWIWRLHLEAESMAVVDLAGVFYRRDVSTSLTRLRDRRQFSFVPAFDSILALVRADPDAEALMPKAVRSYLATLHHHWGTRASYPRPLRRELTALCRDAARRIPAADLEPALAGLDRDRARTIGALVRR